jgi:ribosomal protein L3 glutamine methyltransferase
MAHSRRQFTSRVSSLASRTRHSVATSPAANPAEAAAELISIRDLLRYALTRFAQGEVVHGHGTSSAIDEAAFLILESLRLPVHDINPWLEARLTLAERERLVSLIEARVTTRKPAAYLLGKVYIQGEPFHVDERVIVPRSFIGDILSEGTLFTDGLGLLSHPENMSSVLDLCTGSACLAILAAKHFPNAQVFGVELSTEALDVGKLNVVSHKVQDRVSLLQGDLFEPVKGRKYDLIIANPPYVTSAEVADFPPEYAAEPVLAHLGGTDGMDLVRDIIAEAGAHLNPGGGLLCEVGLGRQILEADYPHLPFIWLDTQESEGEVFWLGADCWKT